MNNLIDAVFVTYMPDLEVLEKSLHSIFSQVRFIYVYDNSDKNIYSSDLSEIVSKFENVSLFSLGGNLGIAKAQNIGLLKSVEASANFTLLSDQDTIYPPDYIEKMFVNWDSLPSQWTVAGIAPSFRDANSGGDDEGFSFLRGINFVRFRSVSACEDVPQVIASGLIIYNKALHDVGYMDENLFIDWVDFEWCWRARSKGYKLVGCNNVNIDHSLGDSSTQINGRKISLHSPKRNYYIVRNGISIALTKKYLPSLMRFNIFLKSIRYIVVFSVFGCRHADNFFCCLRGLFHGLVGRLGPF